MKPVQRFDEPIQEQMGQHNISNNEDDNDDIEKFHGSFYKIYLCTLFPLQVQYCGHIIGAVLADSRPLAQRAAKLVVVEYQDLKPIITIQVRQNLFYLYFKLLKLGGIYRPQM